MVKWRTFIIMTIMGMSWEYETKKNLLKGENMKIKKSLLLSWLHYQGLKMTDFI